MIRLRPTRPRHPRRDATARRRGAVAAVLALTGALFLAPLAPAPAAARETTYVPWAEQLPGWTVEFIPSSENDCVAGRPSCLDATLAELARVLKKNGRRCHHHAVFALSYLRMTQTYGWSRDIPGYYEDVPFANHQDAVFARYYTEAYYAWRDGERAQVPRAWRLAFRAADRRWATAAGDLLLAMNAHINRDLAFTVAAVGLVAPDGSSRKPDFSRVDEFLSLAMEPMLAEAAARFEPSLDDAANPAGLTDTALFQIVSLWRENAWRNAEALVSAPTPFARRLVEAKIETDAVNDARVILASTAYQASDTAVEERAAYCKANHKAPAPLAYPFGQPRPYSPKPRKAR